MTRIFSGLSALIDGNRIGGTVPDSASIIRWVYVGRVAVAIGVFLAASVFFNAIDPVVLLVVAILAVSSLLVSGISVWFTEVKKVELGNTFLYLQMMFDLALVTSVVQITGGLNSDFASLYILVIVVASVLLPFASSLLVTILAGIMYFAVIFWFNQPQLSPTIGLQLAVFVSVALASSWIARKARVAAGDKVVLEQEVERLRLEAGDILRNLRAGILSVDEDGYLAFANQAAERFLSFDSDALVSKDFYPVLDTRSPELGRVIRHTLETGVGVDRYEATIIRDEKEFPIGITTTVLDTGEDGGKSVTAIFTDISAQRQIEELNLRNERLEAVAELSASLAHEIKNPLASIRSSVEQLAHSMQAGEDERFLSNLVVRESDRLSGLLTEFLDFSRVRVTQRSNLPLAQLVESVAAMLRTHPDCRGGSEISVVADPVNLDGDEDLLHRIVFNLVLNALQASGEGARVKIEVREGSSADLPRGVHVECPALLRVRDNGPGIPTDILPRLFDPFVSGRVGGSGLGLAIVQRAVEAHGGAIFVDSHPGMGTTFSVVLPCSGEKEVIRESA